MNDMRFERDGEFFTRYARIFCTIFMRIIRDKIIL